MEFFTGEVRQSGTEDFENDFDTRPYADARPVPENFSASAIRCPVEFAAFSVALFPGEPPAQLVGQNLNRKLFYVSVGGFLIGEYSQLVAGQGYTVSGGEKFTTTSEVFASLPPAAAAPLTVTVWVENLTLDRAGK